LRCQQLPAVDRAGDRARELAEPRNLVGQLLHGVELREFELMCKPIPQGPDALSCRSEGSDEAIELVEALPVGLRGCYMTLCGGEMFGVRCVVLVGFEAGGGLFEVLAACAEQRAAGFELGGDWTSRAASRTTWALVIAAQCIRAASAGDCWLSRYGWHRTGRRARQDLLPGRGNHGLLPARTAVELGVPTIAEHVGVAAAAEVLDLVRVTAAVHRSTALIAAARSGLLADERLLPRWLWSQEVCRAADERALAGLDDAPTITVNGCQLEVDVREALVAPDAKFPQHPGPHSACPTLPHRASPDRARPGRT
jgi:hypothetical protein